MNTETNIYDMWLSSIEHLGSKTILRLQRDTSLGASLGEAMYTMKEKELEALFIECLKDTPRTRSLLENILHARRAVPESIADVLMKKGISYTSMNDESYPDRLRGIPDPPFQLYYFGTLPEDFSPSVGIVGTRIPTIYGKEQARHFSVTLAAAGVQIVSGMARGIDGIAGMGCLDAGGKSFAVLGGGVDICYPPENRNLYEALRHHGGIISEYAPGLLPQSRLFPARNRIISGLSDGILVVEAKERSGTLITVDRALEQGREVFAIPGRVGDRTSGGCNNLIRQGAFIATSPEDILEGIRTPNAHNLPVQKKHLPTADPEDIPSFPDTGTQLAALKAARARTAMEIRNDQNMELIYKPESEDLEAQNRIQEEASLSHLDREILAVLDRSTPYDLNIIATAVSEHMHRQISAAQLIRELTMMILKGLVSEIRVGYYVRK